MQPGSKIRRKPAAIPVHELEEHVKKQAHDPVAIGISALVFISALLTLVFFALSNWSNGSPRPKAHTAVAVESSSVPDAPRVVAAPAPSPDLDSF